jgi:hypothetical protein
VRKDGVANRDRILPHRDRNDAHAIVGRETANAADLDDAMEVARRLSQTLDMPQRPDAVTITDTTRAVFHAGALEADAPNAERPRS